MISDLRIQLYEIALSLSSVVDLVNPLLYDHHKRVAYITSKLTEELHLPYSLQNISILAAVIHDCGAVDLDSQERLEHLKFELQEPLGHAESGYRLLEDFVPLEKVALIIRHHHSWWNDKASFQVEEEPIRVCSNIVHLADRVDVIIDKQKNILDQVNVIRRRVKQKSNTMFAPHIVEAFESLSYKEHFWLDIVSASIDSILRHRPWRELVDLNIENIVNLAHIYRRIIDFRSPYTATHSAGVAAVAGSLARIMGLSAEDRLELRIAGYLHDLGKLTVPKEILEKPDKLTEQEFNIIKGHTYYTYHCLSSIVGLENINEIGSYHHERPDGSGYPFHLAGEKISKGARIMAVADVFTALTEDRPYRDGMTVDNAMQIIRQMADDSALDSDIVSLLTTNLEEINNFRISAQKIIYSEYKQFASQQIYRS